MALDPLCILMEVGGGVSPPLPFPPSLSHRPPFPGDCLSFQCLAAIRARRRHASPTQLYSLAPRRWTFLGLCPLDIFVLHHFFPHMLRRLESGRLCTMIFILLFRRRRSEQAKKYRVGEKNGWRKERLAKRMVGAKVRRRNVAIRHRRGQGSSVYHSPTH